MDSIAQGCVVVIKRQFSPVLTAIGVTDIHVRSPVSGVKAYDGLPLPLNVSQILDGELHNLFACSVKDNLDVVSEGQVDAVLRTSSLMKSWHP